MSANRPWDTSTTPVMNLSNLTQNVEGYGDGKGMTPSTIGGQAFISPHSLNGMMNASETLRLPTTNYYPSNVSVSPGPMKETDRTHSYMMNSNSPQPPPLMQNHAYYNQQSPQLQRPSFPPPTKQQQPPQQQYPPTTTSRPFNIQQSSPLSQPAHTPLPSFPPSQGSQMQAQVQYQDPSSYQQQGLSSFQARGTHTQMPYTTTTQPSHTSPLHSPSPFSPQQHQHQPQHTQPSPYTQSQLPNFTSHNDHALNSNKLHASPLVSASQFSGMTQQPSLVLPRQQSTQQQLMDQHNNAPLSNYPPMSFAPNPIPRSNSHHPMAHMGIPPGTLPPTSLPGSLGNLPPGTLPPSSLPGTLPPKTIPTGALPRLPTSTIPPHATSVPPSAFHHQPITTVNPQAFPNTVSHTGNGQGGVVVEEYFEEEDVEDGDEDDEGEEYTPAAAAPRATPNAAQNRKRIRKKAPDSEEEEAYSPSEDEKDEDEDYDEAPPEDDDDDEYTETPRKSRQAPRSKGKKKSSGAGGGNRSRKPDRFDEEESDDDGDFNLEDSDSDYGGSRKRKAKSRAANKNVVRASQRSRSAKSYNDEDGSDFFDEDDVLPVNNPRVIQEEIEGDTIEKILDHRVVKKPAENGDSEAEDGEQEVTEYFVKWQGWAHIHNTWSTSSYLSQFKGYKKLINYIKAMQKDAEWRQVAPREEIEQADVNREMQFDAYADYVKVERIIAQREVPITEDAPSGVQYLVKWRSLAYCDVTWEPPEELKEYQEEIDSFLFRNQQAMVNASNTRAKQRNANFVPLTQQPPCVAGGKLRDYQLEGLNWLIYSWMNNTNAILADEMGLGKTVQTISFLNYLMSEQNIPGPFLVVVPLSTIPNWEKEFKKWAPLMNVVTYMGNAASRNMIQDFEFYISIKGHAKIKFNALLTTYELILKDKSVLEKIKWEYLAVDEAHRLKNQESMLHEVLTQFKTTNRLLVTGTPLQNSLQELWNLLHFLEPKKFFSLPDFQRQYSSLVEKDQIEKLHAELKPHLLRRLKKEVEKSLPAKIERILRVDMSAMQKQYYKWILGRNYQALNKGIKGGQATLLNIMVELKKTCNHPYLFENAEDLNSNDLLGNLIRNSGKLVLLDKLLVKLKERGHRVLIFSQMVRMLDILADYMRGRGFQMQRLDGSMGREKRQQAMDHFNAESSNDFCFLLSTRAGGLGINLSTADTVIIFDSDWNPQNDLQAESRAHRIGQTKVVNIYRLVTKSTIEEEILEKAKRKMVLDHLVIQSMDTSARPATSTSMPFNKEELEAILKFGAEELFKAKEGEEEKLEEMDIDEILARADVRDTSQDTTAGEELLNAFKVANFNIASTTQDNFWDKVIPDNMKKAEEAPNEELLLPRRRLKLDEDVNTKNTRGPKGKKGAKPAKAKKKSKKGASALDKKDFRAFLRSWKKFGELSRMDEILEDAGLVGKDQQDAIEIAEGILDECRQLAEGATNKKDKLFVHYEDQPVSVHELLQRVDEMEVISQMVAPYIGAPERFRVNVPIKPTNWACKWGPREDAMLLYGVNKYGMGNWDQIREDKSLGLDTKIANTDELDDGIKIKGPMLQRRVEGLVKSYKLEAPKPKKAAATAKHAAPPKKPVPEVVTPPAKKGRRGKKDEDDYEEEVEEESEDEEEEDYDEDYKGKRGAGGKKAAAKNPRGRPKSKTGASPAAKKAGRGTPKKEKEKEKEVEKERDRDSRRDRGDRERDRERDRDRDRRDRDRDRERNDRDRDNKKDAKGAKRKLEDLEEGEIVEGGGDAKEEDEYDKDLVERCKGYLDPIKNVLKKFRVLTEKGEEIPKEKRIKKTKKYLLAIGKQIEERLKQKQLFNQTRLSSHLWYYASTFTSQSGPGLQLLYNKVKSSEQGAVPPSTSPTPSTPPSIPPTSSPIDPPPAKQRRASGANANNNNNGSPNSGAKSNLNQNERPLKIRIRQSQLKSEEGGT